MTTLTEEGLSRALAGMMAQLMQQWQADAANRGQAGTTAGGATATPSKLMHKHFNQVDKLSSASDWREWQYQFLVATKAASLQVGETMEKVQKLMLDEVTAETIAQDVDITQTDEATIGRSKGELFSVLTLWTKGEPNQIVRGVLDQDGFVAWKKLYDRYNPRTPASLTAAWREVIKTKKVRDLREADRIMDV